VFGPVSIGAHAWIETRCVKNRAAHSVNAAHRRAIQSQGIVRDGPGITRVDCKNAFPAAFEPNYVPAEIVGRKRDRTDASVQAGHIAAAG
jgi:hypothetical protein